jgi:hypothetical protein
MVTESPKEVSAKSIKEQLVEIRQKVRSLYFINGKVGSDPKLRHAIGTATLAEAHAFLQKRNEYPKLTADFEELDSAINAAEGRGTRFMEFWRNKGVELE